MGKDQTHLCQVVLLHWNQNLVHQIHQHIGIGRLVLSCSLEVWMGNGLVVLGVGVVGTLVILIMSSCLNLLKS